MYNIQELQIIGLGWFCSSGISLNLRWYTLNVKSVPFLPCRICFPFCSCIFSFLFILKKNYFCSFLKCIFIQTSWTYRNGPQLRCLRDLSLVLFVPTYCSMSIYLEDVTTVFLLGNTGTIFSQ